MAREKRKRPRVIVSKNAFSRFLKKKFGYTDVRQFATSGAFSSRLNSVLLAKDESGNDVFIKACRYGDMSENEYRSSLALWQQAPEHFAKPLAYYSGKRFSFCSSEYVPSKDLLSILESGTLTNDQRAQLVEDIYVIFQALQRAKIVHRDFALKNMLMRNGKVVLIDCQLATKTDSATPISFFDSSLKICLWRWESNPCIGVLAWDDASMILRSLQQIGVSSEYKERFEYICSQVEAARGKCRYEYPYPSMKELERSMRTCRFRSLFHPKSKLRARYSHVLKMLQYLKDNHPLVKNMQKQEVGEP